jgi:glycine cleavage system H protein
MQAGLLSYKLCDRNYECDGCPADLALRGGPAEPHREGVSISPLEFPDDRCYLAAHTWAGTIRTSRVRVGVDALAARFLRHLTSVILPSPASVLSRGQACCWIEDQGATVALPCPVDGPVLRVNRRLRSLPGLIAERPYGEGWLFEIAAERPERSLDGLIDAEAARRRAAEDMTRFREAVMAHRHQTKSDTVGPTLADGGEPPPDLREALGRAVYYGIVSKLLR